MPSVRKQLKRVKSCENTSDVVNSTSANGVARENGDNHRASSSRAEKSRCAAKMRRDKECEELDRLAALLPYPQDVISKLDKASVIRLALCYFQIKHYTRKDGELLFEELKKVNQDDDVNHGVQLDEGEMMLDALGGFLIFVNRAGKVVYIHHQVANILGVQQVEVLGHDATEFIHKEDHLEFKKNLEYDTNTPPSVVTNDSSDTVVQERLFYVRMKCQAGSRHKQAGYILMQWSGRLHVRRGGAPAQDSKHGKTVQPPIGLVAICRPLHSTPIVEIRMDGNMFITRHNMEMRFTFCDTRILSLLGYEPTELIGKTAYQFHNPHDAQKIKTCHASLMVKGTGVSKFYRFMGKTGRWVWMKSRGTVIYNTNHEPQYVVCINYVYTDEVGKRWQLLEEQRGQTQEPTIQGFIDMASVEAASSKNTAAQLGLTDSELSENGLNSSSSASPSSLSSPSSTTSPAARYSAEVQQDGNEVYQTEAYHNRISLVLDSGSPMAVGSSSDDNVFGDDNSPTSLPVNGAATSSNHSSSSNTSFSPAVSDNVPYNSNSEFNTDICLDESTFDLGEDTLQWLEENLLKSIQQEQSQVVVSQQQQQQLQQPQSHHSTSQPIPITSTAQNHVIISTTIHPSQTTHPQQQQQHVLPPPQPRQERSHSYTAIATDHDYSAKPGDKVRGAPRHRSYQSSPVDIEMYDDGSNDAKFHQSQAQPYKSQIHGHQQHHNVPVSSNQQNIDSILVALLGNSKNQQAAGVPGRYSSKGSSASSTQQQNNHTNNHHQHNAPKSASISISAFPSADMLGHSTGVVDANTERFAMKFAENFVDQQGPEQLLPFLSDAMETPIDNPLTCLQDDTMVTSSPPTGPFSGSNDCPFTDNLYYGFSQLSGSPSFHSIASGAPPQTFASDQLTSSSLSPSSLSSSWRQSHDLRSPTSPTKERKSPNGGPSLLEKFLLTKQPLNPNAGSDKVFKDTKVTEKISQLNLTDPLNHSQDRNLLKQLLTGEIDDKRMHQYEQRVISTRRSDTDTPPCGGTDLPMDMGFGPSDSHLGMDLFSGGAAGDMDSLLTNDMDMSMYGDVSDILREQIRQEDLWLQEYFTADV